MRQFHSALRALAEHWQLGKFDDELLCDIFTANMSNEKIQKELLGVTLDPAKALKPAMCVEL